MLALTLIQPWAYALAFLGKDVENRGWRPPRSAIGQRIALHAGKKCSRADIETLRVLGHELPDVQVASALLATALLAGWVKSELEHSGTLTPAEVSAALRSPWRVDGAIAWVPRDVQALERPVSCSGAQGLWRVPQIVEEELLALRHGPHRAPAPPVAAPEIVPKGGARQAEARPRVRPAGPAPRKRRGVDADLCETPGAVDPRQLLLFG